ncbi:MAG TPA: glycosyltransferase family 39 protein [Steroidobacteraceae bacterium]|nr:glycosyltransferase family 39 protein [Steroidobacteraceae bacterium]
MPLLVQVRTRTALAVGSGTTLFYLAFLSPVIYAIDGISMLAVTESLLTHGSVAVPKALGIEGLGGLYYSKWYPLLSFLVLPQVALGMTLAHLMHLPPHFMAGSFALILPPVLIGATTSVVVMLAARLGASQRGSIVAAIGFAFGTVALVYAREFFAEPLLALITAVAIYHELGNQRERKMVAIWTALAVLAKPTGVVLGPILAIHAVLRDRSVRSAVAPLVGMTTGLGIYFFYNYIRFGEVLTFGMSGAYGLLNLPAGAAGLLASPGRGLIWYCPVVLALAGLSARLWKRLDVLPIVLVALGYLGIYGVWSDWTGGWCWGPRYLLPALPGLMALCGLLEGQWRKLLVVLTILAFVVNAPTLVSYYQRLYAEELAAQEEPDLWSLSRAPFVRIWGSTWREIGDARRTDVRLMVQHAGEGDNSEASSERTFRIVAVWWWMLPMAHIPRAVGAAVAALLAVTGLGLIWWTWHWPENSAGSCYLARPPESP